MKNKIFELKELESRLEMQVVMLPDGTGLSAEEAESLDSCTENCGSCSGSKCLVF